MLNIKIFAPVVVDFLETRRQSLVGQHLELGSVNTRRLLPGFEDQLAENMTTGFVERKAKFRVHEVDEESQKTSEGDDDSLSDAESYATAEDRS